VTTIDELRRYAVSRSLFRPTTLERALDTFGFVQADPIRAPARAQDLILRHRVDGYRAGDLDRRYPALPVEEDVFINYGFVTRALQRLMHPRAVASLRPTSRNARARALLAFVGERGAVHPRDVDAQFSHGTTRNYWGGSSLATTHLLDAMHYKGLLRVVRRENGIRLYATQTHDPAPTGAAARDARVDALVDVVVRLYAPLPAPSLSYVVSRLRYAAPQWRGQLRAALQRASRRLSHARIDGVEWYWPLDEHPSAAAPPDGLRLLAPFDPIVWDRRRFELLWRWPYRFEAYTPVARRTRGYYAMPLLWRDGVIGWGNVSVINGDTRADLGFIDGRRPRNRAFGRELDAELNRLRAFLDRRDDDPG
jgi:uncharacterized protein